MHLACMAVLVTRQNINKFGAQNSSTKMHTTCCEFLKLMIILGDNRPNSFSSLIKGKNASSTTVNSK